MTGTARHRPTLVMGGTGKIGHIERLMRRDIPVRIGSRPSGLPFDRDQPSTWGPVFQDVEAAYTSLPDMVVSNPTDAIAGKVMSPVGDVGEPFSDTDDIADVAATVLTEDGHGGERVLGRPARDFADYARATAATDVRTPTDQPKAGGPR